MADVDGCSDMVHECGAVEKCVNKEGGYSCECKKGYCKKNGARVKKESLIYTLKELKDHNNNNNNLKSCEKRSRVKKSKA